MERKGPLVPPSAPWFPRTKALRFEKAVQQDCRGYSHFHSHDHLKHSWVLHQFEGVQERVAKGSVKSHVMGSPGHEWNETSGRMSGHLRAMARPFGANREARGGTAKP